MARLDRSRSGSISADTAFPRPDLLPERLADWITGEIVSGRFAPGERLVELSLTKRCKVSRVPLREALRIVAGRGLVTLEPHRGAVVAALSGAELNDLFGLRLALEGFAAAALAMRRPPAALADLRRMNAEMKTHAAARETEAYYALAARFHDAMVEAAGNGLLTETYGRIKVRFRRYQAVLSGIVELPARSVVEHAAILEAVQAGDAERARALVEAHIRGLVDAYGRSTRQPPVPGATA